MVHMLHNTGYRTQYRNLSRFLLPATYVRISEYFCEDWQCGRKNLIKQYYSPSTGFLDLLLGLVSKSLALLLKFTLHRFKTTFVYFL